MKEIVETVTFTKEVTKYVAEDGKVFSEKDSCLLHESMKWTSWEEIVDYHLADEYLTILNTSNIEEYNMAKHWADSVDAEGFPTLDTALSGKQVVVFSNGYDYWCVSGVVCITDMLIDGVQKLVKLTHKAKDNSFTGGNHGKD